MFPELKITNHLIESIHAYPEFDDAAHNVAERLVILGHLTFNRDVWAVSSERLKRYWSAYAENIEGNANTNKLSVWWAQFTQGMASKPFNDMQYLHEKNLLLDPVHLSTPVKDEEVLEVFRRETSYLIDRTRVWVNLRKKSKDLEIPQAPIEMQENN